MSDERKYYCLKCGSKIKEFVSLCSECLSKEFIKMDHGEPSGYLYAAELYHLKKQRDKE